MPGNIDEIGEGTKGRLDEVHEVAAHFVAWNRASIHIDLPAAKLNQRYEYRLQLMS